MLHHKVNHLLLFGNSSLSISGKCLVMTSDHNGVFWQAVTHILMRTYRDTADKLKYVSVWLALLCDLAEQLFMFKAAVQDPSKTSSDN